MTALEAAREAIPAPARDLALNIQTVLGESSLGEAQRWGVPADRRSSACRRGAGTGRGRCSSP